MDKEKFIELVKEALEKKTGKEVIVHKTVKNNGVTLTGVSLKDEEVNMLPIIYIDEYNSNTITKNIFSQRNKNITMFFWVFFLFQDSD